MVAAIQPGYCFSEQSKAKLRKILGKYKLCLSTYKAVVSLPYGGQRHKAAAGIANGSAKSLRPLLSPAARQRRSSSKERRALQQLAAAVAPQHDSVWKYFAALSLPHPSHSIWLLLNRTLTRPSAPVWFRFTATYAYLSVNKHSAYLSLNMCWRRVESPSERKPSDASRTSTVWQWADPDPGGRPSAQQVGF